MYACIWSSKINYPSFKVFIDKKYRISFDFAFTVLSRLSLFSLLFLLCSLFLPSSFFLLSSHPFPLSLLISFFLLLSYSLFGISPSFFSNYVPLYCRKHYIDFENAQISVKTPIRESCFTVLYKQTALVTMLNRRQLNFSWFFQNIWEYTWGLIAHADLQNCRLLQLFLRGSYIFYIEHFSEAALYHFWCI